jgi:uncharacterized protein YbjT (DUF2867 family)
MTNICLVTGANGHLGNNLVRALLDKREKVRASVRNVNYLEPFEGLDCEEVYADLLDRESISKATKGVDTLYQVAAVYKIWAKNPEEEILRVNPEGIKNRVGKTGIAPGKRTGSLADKCIAFWHDWSKLFWTLDAHNGNSKCNCKYVQSEIKERSNYVFAQIKCNLE